LFIEGFILGFYWWIRWVDELLKFFQKKVKINFANTKKVSTFAIPNGTDLTGFGKRKEKTGKRDAYLNEKSENI